MFQSLWGEVKSEIYSLKLVFERSKKKTNGNQHTTHDSLNSGNCFEITLLDFYPLHLPVKSDDSNMEGKPAMKQQTTASKND